MDEKPCPASWNLASLAKVSQTLDPKNLEKTLYANSLLGVSIDAKFSNRKQTLDGGKGSDFLGWSGGNLLLGDYRIVNFENIINHSNGPFKAVLLMSGMASAENWKMSFHHKNAPFEVYLDSCLTWSFPEKINEPVSKDKLSYDWRILGTDPLGNKVSIRFSSGVKLQLLSSVVVKRWIKALVFYRKDKQQPFLRVD